MTLTIDNETYNLEIVKKVLLKIFILELKMI